MKQSQKKKTTDGVGSKKKYEKPSITSESLMTFGALCNGMAGGGRKASAGAPDFCGATKLLS